MNGQYLCNRQITASYAYKKDTKGERHGTPAERVLAASNPTAQKSRPHTLFASGPPTLPNGPQANGTMGTPVPPRPFVNSAIPPAPMTPLRPPAQAGVFVPMPMSGPPSWQGQPQQPGQPVRAPAMPPPPLQQFRPPPPSMPPPPPPPPQVAQVFARPPPPPTGMAAAPPVWRPPPPPQQLAGRPPSMPQMSMPPPTQLNALHHPLLQQVEI